MAAPVFEFTDRATPIVQFGRSVNRQLGNDRWGRSRWGQGRWGADDWEPDWADATCEIHEITTNTGRGSAADRFVPGTAHIVASNVTGLSSMIFPELGPQRFAPVPQPPISHEEELQAPNATTVTSNGWSFTDDFETRPPRWVFPTVFATTGEFPTVPMVWAGGHVEPELYVGTDATWEAHGAAQWTGPYPAPELVDITMTVTNLDWSSDPAVGIPRAVFDLYVYANATDRAATAVRFTVTPDFDGATRVTIEPFRMGPAGEIVDLIATTTVPAGLGVNGHVVPLLLTVRVNAFNHTVVGLVNGVGTPEYAPAPAWFAAGNRIGFAVDYYEGDLNANPSGVPHITRFETADFVDEFDRPTGSGWVPGPRRVLQPMLMNDGALQPVTVWDPSNHAYRATGAAQWVSEFDGDQFIEAEISGTDMPHPLQAPAITVVQLYLKANRRDLSAVVAEIDYLVGWDPDHTTIDWYLQQHGPDGQIVYNPGVSGWGTIDYGVSDGRFPQPARWRLEADDDGVVRLYHDRQLIGGPVTFPDIPQGGRVGVYMSWGAGAPDTVGDPRPQPARINQMSGGLREPLGTEELGMWVRIGVHHTTVGNCWFFRGFVDGVVPTYLPERQDAVRIECIDSLGEAGRAHILNTSMGHRFAEAQLRIRQVLNLASWPRKKRRIADDATIMSRPNSGKAVDALTHIAESCGGAVYGDPADGDVVFWGQDWQAFKPGTPPAAFITNHMVDDDVIRVCPVGWELSQHRQDMCTRARFSTVTSVTDDEEAIVREWRNVTAEGVYGIELVERTVLCVTVERVDELVNRHLRLRSPRSFPRVEAVLLDAATASEALDLMATAQFTRAPSRYQCQLRRGDEWVFNRQYLVTGIRHRITPTKWTCRLQLDIASAFVAHGGRWGRSRWNQPDATWGRTR